MIAAFRTRTYDPFPLFLVSCSVISYLLFILEGVQYSYFLKDDKSYVMAFTYPIGISGIPESFLSQQPSTYTLEAITASRALLLSHGELMRLFDAFPSLERLFRKITEALLIAAAHGRYRQV